MNKNTDILTIGDCSVDLYMRVSDKSFTEDFSDKDQPKVCFIHGTKIPVDKFDTSIAGNSLNVAVAANYLGLKTEIYTETGKDDNSKRLLSELKKMNISTRLIKRNENTRTDVHAIIVFGGERTIFSYHGERRYKLQQWGKPKFIYYTSIGRGFEPFQKELIQYLNDNPQIGVIFNPGTFQLKAGNDHLLPVLAVSDVLFLNREEAEELTDTGKDDAILTVHQKLQKTGPKLTIVTDAEKGATAYDGISLLSQSAYSDNRPIEDKTGAGDAFAAAFTSALIYGKSIADCLKWGAANSGSLIKEIGATNGLLKKEEIEIIAGRI